MFRSSIALVCLGLSGAAFAQSPATLVDEIDGIVRAHYYAPQRLEALGWPAAVATARAALAGPGDPAAPLDTLLATLAASHTRYYPRTDPGYWAMAGIFEPVIKRICPEATQPPLPVTADEIGVFWKRFDGSWFVGGLYAGGPAETAGLKLGDEVLSADGQPFAPVAAFAGKAGQPVALMLRRQRGDPAVPASVTPHSVKPHEALRQATEASARIIESGKRRIAYLHIWSWTSIEIQQVVLQAITKANQDGVDGFILDLRDGWGGASPNYLTIFDRAVPVLQSIDPQGATASYDAQIRKPAILLVNGGTRSGKEIVAYGAKKHRLARLVGERTAGAVLFGQPFCLSNGALLYLAAYDATIDGARLEGEGVAPDVTVPFDPRYAGGTDPQLDRALQLLSQ